MTSCPLPCLQPRTRRLSWYFRPRGTPFWQTYKSLGYKLLPGLVALGAASFASAQNNGLDTLPQMDLPKRHFAFGAHHFVVQMATSPRARSAGLMHRKSMPENEGMLFVFQNRGIQCFWMKNTLIPLSTAFIADDGRIVNIADMQPLSVASHCSEQPVRFVLEMNQGWFQKRGLGSGNSMRETPPPAPVQP